MGFSRGRRDESGITAGRTPPRVQSASVTRVYAVGGGALSRHPRLGRGLLAHKRLRRRKSLNSAAAAGCLTISYGKHVVSYSKTTTTPPGLWMRIPPRASPRAQKPTRVRVCEWERDTCRSTRTETRCVQINHETTRTGCVRVTWWADRCTRLVLCGIEWKKSRRR